MFDWREVVKRSLTTGQSVATHKEFLSVRKVWATYSVRSSSCSPGTDAAFRTSKRRYLQAMGQSACQERLLSREDWPKISVVKESLTTGSDGKTYSTQLYDIDGVVVAPSVQGQLNIFIMPEKEAPESSIILYQTKDNRTRIEGRFDADALLRLTEAQIAELFQTSIANISLHLKAICIEGELAETATIKSYLIVRSGRG